MKPKNFPARKLKRQIDAQKRLDGTSHLPYTDVELKRLDEARKVRTKQHRGNL